MRTLVVPVLLASLQVTPSLAQSGETAPAVRLTLEEALASARETSARLASLSATTRAASDGVRLARAARLPEIELQAAYSRNSNVPELILATPGASPRTIFPNLPDNWRARVGATLPLYTGGRIQNEVAAGEASERAASFDRVAAVRDLELETHVAYVNVLLARETARVLLEGVAAYDAHHKDAKSRHDLGLIANHEVLAVSVERERSEFGRVQADNLARIAEATLARLVGLPPGTSLALEPAWSEGTPALESAEEMARRAAAERPEIDALRARVRSIEASAASARAATRPQALLQAGYDYANPNPKILPLTGAWNDTWSIGINVNWKLLDGGKADAVAARAEAQAESLRAQLADLESRIRLEVVTRRLELDSAIAGKTVAARAVEAAREAVRVAQDRYREGVLTSSDRLDAENRLLSAQLEVTRNEAQIQVAQANLARASGR